MADNSPRLARVKMPSIRRAGNISNPEALAPWPIRRARGWASSRKCSRARERQIVTCSAISKIRRFQMPTAFAVVPRSRERNMTPPNTIWVAHRNHRIPTADFVASLAAKAWANNIIAAPASRWAAPARPRISILRTNNATTIRSIRPLTRSWLTISMAMPRKAKRTMAITVIGTMVLRNSLRIRKPRC